MHVRELVLEEKHVTPGLGRRCAALVGVGRGLGVGVNTTPGLSICSADIFIEQLLCSSPSAVAGGIAGSPGPSWTTF